MADKKKAVTAILGPESQNVEKREDGMREDDEMLHAMGEELIEALHSKDVAGVIAGMRALFDAFDSQPHEEGPHIK
jgi:hypothetical protein